MLNGLAVKLHLHRRAAEILDLDFDNCVRPHGCAQGQCRKQHRTCADGRRGDGHVIEPVVGADGRCQFRRAGAETEVAGDRGVWDAEVVIDLGAVVHHVQCPIGIQLDMNRHEDGRLIIGRPGAEAGKSFCCDSLPADPHDDTRRIAGVVAVGAESRQVIHRVEGNDQSLTEPCAFPGRAAFAERIGE
ncbi:MAG: hypothetical protein DME18_13575 [Verrucomicrobia bacterium]|nr:MAG: hypothetical protein DME18_13575 [Verrucomicrobiota bacterium]